MQTPQQRINYCPNAMFVYPVTENEVACVTNSLKGNSSAGFDKIPEFLVNQCTCYLKKTLVHIYNASFQSGIFPDKMKIAKVRPLFKKGDRHPEL
jgi:hypothetical protein